jgi:hypothetical protein
MNKRKCFLRAGGWVFGALLLSACVGKRPDDDVALIKQLLAKFERGVNGSNVTVLDSIVLDKKSDISSQLLDSLSFGRKLEGGRIAKKSFVIVRDSAEVRLKLDLEYAWEEQKPDQSEKPLELFLRKKRGKWRIQSFSLTSDQEQ